MTEIISYYSVAPSQGKRTLSLSMAESLAEQGYKTALIELDDVYPALSIANQITNEYKNTVEFFQKAVNSNQFNISEYVINKSILVDTDNRDFKKRFAEYPDKLDFLVFPKNFRAHHFPVIVKSNEENAERKAHEFIQKFMYSLKTSSYDYVILNLPNNLEHLFCFEVIGASDRIINVVTPAASRLFENKEIIEYLTSNISGLQNKLYTIVNQASLEVDITTYKELTGVKDSNKVIVIPYDPERLDRELALKIGSPTINYHIERVALLLDIKLNPATNKKKKIPFFREKNNA